MSLIPDDLVYSKNHVWLRPTEDYTITCGITDYAQELLRDIVFIESVDEGIDVNAGEKILYIESVTDIFDLLSPLSGRLIKINWDLVGKPEIINEDPYGEGWIFEIDYRSTIELEEMMDHEAYRTFIEE